MKKNKFSREELIKTFINSKSRLRWFGDGGIDDLIFGFFQMDIKGMNFTLKRGLLQFYYIINASSYGDLFNPPDYYFGEYRTMDKRISDLYKELRYNKMISKSNAVYKWVNDIKKGVL